MSKNKNNNGDNKVASIINHLNKTPQQLTPAQFIQAVQEQGKDMVCGGCGFGFLLQGFALKMVPSSLHPQPIPGVFEQPLPLLAAWFCPKCEKYQGIQDLKILERVTPEKEKENEKKEEAVSAKSEPSPKREYIGQKCIKCDSELYKIDKTVYCPRGCI